MQSRTSHVHNERKISNEDQLSVKIEKWMYIFRVILICLYTYTPVSLCLENPSVRLKYEKAEWKGRPWKGGNPWKTSFKLMWLMTSSKVFHPPTNAVYNFQLQQYTTTKRNLISAKQAWIPDQAFYSSSWQCLPQITALTYEKLEDIYWTISKHPSYTP